MAFAPLYNKLAELELKVSSMSSGLPITPGNAEKVDLEPMLSKIAMIEEKLAVPPIEYATVDSVSTLVEKYNQVTAVLTQFNMQLSTIVERINALEAK